MLFLQNALGQNQLKIEILVDEDWESQKSLAFSLIDMIAIYIVGGLADAPATRTICVHYNPDTTSV